MVQKEAVSTDKAPPPMPFLSQAIKCQGMVSSNVHRTSYSAHFSAQIYCSGSIGADPKTKELVEGSVGDRTVGQGACFPAEPSLTSPMRRLSRWQT